MSECICHSNHEYPASNAIYYTLSSYFTVVCILLLWTLILYCQIYYGKFNINKLQIIPIYWAGASMGVKFVGTLLILCQVDYFNCLLLNCDNSWRNLPRFQTIRLLQIIEYFFLLMFIRCFMHEA